MQWVAYPRWTYEGLMINEFSRRVDREVVLDAYSFNDFDK
jgi:hypothetical protein